MVPPHLAVVEDLAKDFLYWKLTKALILKDSVMESLLIQVRFCHMTVLWISYTWNKEAGLKKN